jgi:hypothetical protein
MLQKLKMIYQILREIAALPKVRISMKCDSDACQQHYGNFVKRHPRYLIIPNKAIGVALVDLNEFPNSAAYLGSFSGKNSAAYRSRRCLRQGYRFEEIDRNCFIEDIHEINTSLKERQGREMDKAYREKKEHYPVQENCRYFGVLKCDKLVAYAWVVVCGEIATIGHLLGHGDHLKDGVMYLLVTRIISLFLDEAKEVKYVMYDTVFGASKGLKIFKKQLGFRPYHVQWQRQ